MRLVNALDLGASRDTGDIVAPQRVPIGVPLWSGLAAVVVAVFIGFATALIAAVMFAIITGGTTDFSAGHIGNTLVTFAFYGGSGVFAWWALNMMQNDVLHALTRRDVIVVLIGIGAIFAARIVGGVVLIAVHLGDHVQAGFEHFSVSTPEPSVTALSAILVFVSLVIVGPIVEEVVFRGLLFGALSRPLGVVFGAILSGLLFGALHGDWVLFPLIAALGVVNALAYARTHNLAVPMIIHAANNGLAAIFLIPLALHAH